MFWGVFSQFSGVKFGIPKCCLCKRNDKYQVCPGIAPGGKIFLPDFLWIILFAFIRDNDDVENVDAGKMMTMMMMRGRMRGYSSCLQILQRPR